MSFLRNFYTISTCSQKPGQWQGHFMSSRYRCSIGNQLFVMSKYPGYLNFQKLSFLILNTIISKTMERGLIPFTYRLSWRGNWDFSASLLKKISSRLIWISYTSYFWIVFPYVLRHLKNLRARRTNLRWDWKTSTDKCAMKWGKRWKIADGANIAEEGRKSDDRLHSRGGGGGRIVLKQSPGPFNW